MRAIVLLCCFLLASPAFAWGPQGHKTIGAIADALLSGTRAGREVRALLGDERLEVAALWADCAKSVTERWPQHYIDNPRFKDCRAFETLEGRVALEDYVRRNLRHCGPAAGGETCHRQYHYADIAVQRNEYSPRFVGASDHDVVAATTACITVLRGGRAPAPFDIQGRREALRLLAHFVGDLHQPLHVGTVYLDARGQVLDPDRSGFLPGSDTHGGNALHVGKDRLHEIWDRTPPRLKAERFAVEGARQARLLPHPPGPMEQWPAGWASESLRLGQAVYAGMRFGGRGQGGVSSNGWAVEQRPTMPLSRDRIQEQQLVKAGARLAQLLEAIWP